MKTLIKLSDAITVIAWLTLGIVVAVAREVILFTRDLVLVGYLGLCVGAVYMLGFVLNPYVFGGLLFAYVAMKI